MNTWIRAIPYKNLQVGKDSVICEKHWPESYPTVSKKGKQKPKDPPSVFAGVPQSCIATPAVKPRTTKRTSFVIRSTLPDEIELFNQRDKVSFSEIIARTTRKHNVFCCPTTSFVNGALLRIQSQEFSEGVPKVLICIEETLNFDCYHMGIKINIPCIAKNRITTLT